LALDADAIEPRVRLMEIAGAAGDWKAVRAYAEQVLGINPLIAAPHRHLAQAAEALGERPLAIESHRTLLLLDPLDRSEHHYRLGRLLLEEKQLAAARREVVKSLEEAPRYRDAHRLLIEIAGKMTDDRDGAKPAAATRPATAPVATRPATSKPTAPTPAPAPTAQPANSQERQP
jgi:tetratricopeptide (TPR) repeat protein